jgi:Domain of unknown function (DUF4440)
VKQATRNRLPRKREVTPVAKLTALSPMVVLTMALIFVGIVYTPGLAHADVCRNAATGASLPLGDNPCADVLAQEVRWLKAITDGDRATVESILSANYIHIDRSGKLFDRAAEINNTKVLLFSMTPSEQTVDIADDIAVVHGLNTIDYGSRGTEKVRFTDVFILQNGTWMALSAQETAI